MKKTCWLLLLVVGLGAICWLIFRHEPREIDSTSPVATDPVVSNQSASSQSVPDGVPPSPPAPQESSKPGLKDWAYFQTVKQLMLEANQPIEFHARFVDQEGQPVSGVLLKMYLSRVDEELVEAKFPNMNMGDEHVEETVTLESDAAGRVSLTGRKGKSVAVLSLTKDGYSWVSPPLGSWAYKPGGKHNYGYKGMEAAFDRSKGYVFQMWKKGRADRVIPLSVRVDMDIEQQGQWVSNYFVGFLSGKVLSSNFRGVDLLIQGVRHPTGLAKRPYEFTFTLTVPNGGIQASEDFYPYRPPETGYKTSWTFVNKPMSRGPEDGPWTKTFYFKLRDGKAFAGMKVSFQKNNFDLVFDGYLNPAGSRNLEPDPNLLITDPEEIRRLDLETSK